MEIRILLLILTVLLAGSARAQTSDAPKVGSEIEKVAPYSGWKAHTGAIEDCLALFTVEPDGDAPLMYLTGVVVRCDGFILVPVAVYDALGKPGWKVRVTLSGAEGERLPQMLGIDGKPSHRSHRAKLHVVKVSNHHLKSVRLLDPRNLTSGMPVKIYAATPQRAGLGRLVWEGTVGQAGEKESWGLSFPEGKAPTTLEPGAMVVDAASGAVVGMVGQGGGAPFSFASLAYFNDNTAEVALCPDRDAALGKPPKDSKMVLVKGGPVEVSDKDFRARYKTQVACTPDFWCDARPMSVGDYDAWMATKPGVPLPTSWTFRQSPKHPRQFPDWPVTGVRPEELRWIAADTNKRLLTWVEWQRASYLPDVAALATPDDIQREIQEIELADLELEMRVEAHTTMSAANTARAMNTNPSAGRGSGRSAAPGFRAGLAARTMEAAGLAEILQQWVMQVRGALRRLFSGIGESGAAGRGPGWVRPIGADGKDRSVWDVYEVATNVPEQVLDRGMTTRIVAKPLGAHLDPFLSTVQWVVEATVGGGGATRDPLTGLAAGRIGQSHIVNAAIDDEAFWRTVYDARFGDRQIQTEVTATPFSGREISVAFSLFRRTYDVTPRVLPGFRLAR